MQYVSATDVKQIKDSTLQLIKSICISGFTFPKELISIVEKKVEQGLDNSIALDILKVGLANRYRLKNIDFFISKIKEDTLKNINFY